MNMQIRRTSHVGIDLSVWMIAAAVVLVGWQVPATAAEGEDAAASDAASPSAEERAARARAEAEAERILRDTEAEARVGSPRPEAPARPRPQRPRTIMSRPAPKSTPRIRPSRTWRDEAFRKNRELEARRDAAAAGPATRPAASVRDDRPAPTTRPAGTGDTETASGGDIPPPPRSKGGEDISLTAEELPDVSDDQLTRLLEAARNSTQPSNEDSDAGSRATTGVIPKDQRTGLPDLKAEPDWYILPYDQRPYFFSWKDASIDQVLDDFGEMTGLSWMGRGSLASDPKAAGKKITFQSVKIMEYDEALLTLDLLLEEHGLWVVHRGEYLEVRSLSDWQYRRIPPDRRYDSFEAYQEANLPDWEVVSLVYTPKEGSPTQLVSDINMLTPDQTAVGRVLPDTGSIQIQGCVHYIKWQLDYLQGYEKTDPPEVWRVYKIENISAAEAKTQLEQMLGAEEGEGAPAEEGQPNVPRGPRRPSPARAQRGGAPGGAATTVLDEVAILIQSQTDCLMIKASPENHELVADYLKTYIDVPSGIDPEIHIIQLKEIDPEELIPILQTLMAEKRVVQRQAPQPKKGQPQPPAPPPTVMQIETTAEFEALPNKQLLVKANEEQMEKVNELVEVLDVADTAGDSYRYVEIEHGSAAEIAATLNAVLSSPRSRRIRRPGQASMQTPFRASADTTTDKAIVLVGTVSDMDDAQKLIAQLDVDPESGASEHMVTLENAVPSAMVTLLSDRFDSGGGGGYARSRYPYRGYGGGGGGSQLPRFIPDDESKTLIVVCYDETWPAIDELIRTIDEKRESQSTTRTYALQHVNAANVAQLLGQALDGGGGGYSRYPYARTTGTDDQPSFLFDAQSNLLIVKATEEIHEKAADLIEKLDRPGPAEERDFRPISLEKADAEYVAGKIEELFQSGGGSRRSPYGYPYGGYASTSSSGGAPKPPIRVIAETITNRVLVSASDEDFAKAEQLAKTIDQTYAAQNYEHKTFILQHADPWDVEQVVRAVYPEAGGGRRGYGGYSTGSETPGGIRIADTDNGLVVVAPQEKMEEISALIEQLDQSPTADNEVKMYKVENTDYNGTMQIADQLSELYAGGGGGRYSRSSRNAEVKFIGNYGSDLLFVSAPPEKMVEIDAKVTDFLQARNPVDLTKEIRHFEIKQAKAQDVANMLEPILEERYEELEEQQGGGRGGYRGWGRSDVEVTARPAQRKIMVMAPSAMMDEVAQLVAEFDQPPRPSITVRVQLETAKAAEIAPIIEEQMRDFASTSSSRSRSSRYRGYYPSWGGYSGSSAGGDDELRVTVVESSNSIMLTGIQEKVEEAAQLIRDIDKESRPEGPMIRTYPLEYAELWETASMIESVTGGGGLDSFSTTGSSTGVRVSTDYATNQLIVTAPFEKFPLIEETIALKEKLAKIAEDQGDIGEGDVFRGEGGTIKKLYEVKGPAKEIAQTLDRILLSMIGYDAPIVKPFFFGNQIVVSGEAKYFDKVEHWLKKLEEDPPPVVPMVWVKRTTAAKEVVERVSSVANVRLDKGVRTIEMPKSKSAMGAAAALREREIDWYTPIETPSQDEEEEEIRETGGSPFVAPNTVMRLHEELAALSWTQSATTQPSIATRPAETGAKQPAPEAKVSDLVEDAVAEEAATAETTPLDQVREAAAVGSETGQLQILYDEEQGLIIYIGSESDIEEIQDITERVIEQLEIIDKGEADADIRVFKVEYIDVTVASEILQQMFNAQAQRGKQAKPRQPKRKSEQKPQPGEEGEEESEAAKMRREQEAEEERAQAEEEQQRAAAQQIRVFPDPRTRTLIIRAAPELFPRIGELLLKIDRPGTGAPVDIKIFKLENLNAYEVEQAIKAILKIEDPERLRRRFPRGRGGEAAARQTADMIEQLQEQVMEMRTAAAQAAAAGAGAEGEGEGPGKFQINPSKDITITSDATTNTIIVAAPEVGMELVEKLINQLEEQPIPIQVKAIELQNASAESVSAELEKVFESGRRFRGGDGEGITPSQIGDVRIAADVRTNKLVIRALDSDMEKILPIVDELDVPPSESQVQLYSVDTASVTDVAEVLNTLFVQDPAATGPQAVKITASSDTSTIAVRAPDAQQLLIAKKIEELDEKGRVRQVPKQIELNFANADGMAQQLREIFTPSTGRGSRAAQQRISITGDTNSRIVFVTAPDEMFEQIKSVAEMMDVPPEQQVKVIKLQYASATEIQGQFREIATQLIRQLRGPSASASDFPAITADPRLNALIVVGSPAALMVVDPVIKQLDQKPSGPTQTTVTAIAMPLGNASTVASSINSLYRDAEYISGVKPPRAVASGSNVLYIYGTQPQIEEIKSSVVDRYNTIAGETQTEVQQYELELAEADVDDAAAFLNNWFNQRASNLRTAGITTIPQSELAVSILPDPATKKLYISCSEANFKTIQDLMEGYDKVGAGPGGQVTKVIPVKFANISYVTTALTSTFRQTGRVPESEKITITPEYSSNSIIVKAREDDLKQIEELLAQVDTVETTSYTRETIKLEHVKASQLASTMNEYIRTTMRPDQRTRQYPVVVTPNDATNTLTITSNEQHLARMKEMIAELDVEPPASGRETRPYPLRFADLNSAITAVRTQFQENENRPIDDQVSVTSDPWNNVMLVTASPKNHDKVAEIVDRLDVSGMKRLPEPEMIKVEHVRASDLARLLNEMIRQNVQIDRRTRTYPITVTPNDATSSLIVTADPSDMEQMRALIEQLDVPQPEDDIRTTKTYAVQHADANSIVRIIDEQYRDNETLSKTEQVEAIAERVTNSVVVRASEDHHADIASLITQIDTSDNARRQTYPLQVENAEPEDVAQALTTIYNTAMPRSRSGRMPASFTVPRGSRIILATCTPSELEDIKQLISELDQSAGAEVQRSMRVVPVTTIAPREMSQILTEYLRKPGRSGRSDPTLLGNVKVTYSDSASAIVLSGPEDRLTELEELIGTVDDQADPGEKGPGVRQMEVIPLENADPNSVASVITRSFTKRGAVAEAERVDAVAERATNSLVVTATEEKLERIRAMVNELDQQSSNTPQQKMVELKHARADELADVLSTTYRSGRRGSYGPPISFSADLSTNSLVVSAGQADMQGILEMIERLDKPATDQFEEMRIIALKHADAQETLDVLEEVLRKSSGGRRRGGSDLIGDIRLQASATMNAVIASGSKEELDRIEQEVLKMDQEVIGAGRPKTIKIQEASASQLAATLTKIFTDPARRSRGRSNPEMVPLILADEGTNTLVVRARPNDYLLIEEMVEELDVEDQGEGSIKVIAVDRGTDVVSLARNIQNTINAGESYLARTQPGHIARQVAIMGDQRASALIVAGPPEMFERVEKTVTELQEIQPGGGDQTARVIRLEHVPARDAVNMVNQIIEAQQGGRR